MDNVAVARASRAEYQRRRALHRQRPKAAVDQVRATAARSEVRAWGS